MKGSEKDNEKKYSKRFRYINVRMVGKMFFIGTPRKINKLTSNRHSRFTYTGLFLRHVK